MSSTLIQLAPGSGSESGLWCNIGPPLARYRTERLAETLLGDTEKEIAWPLVERVGLLFDRGANPLAFIENLLRREGFRSPEQLRKEIQIPPGMLTCRTIGDDADGIVKISRADPGIVLRQALILGLCGPSFYDPNKAVIWTNSRLLRKLDLFQPGRFYADN